MELKPYQKKVVEDLSLFLDYVEKENDYAVAYTKYRQDKGFRVDGLDPKALPLYKNTIPNCPHVCMKVPTAGGKTFIACNALKPIFDKFPITKEKVVVRLVPSVTILDQTINNLSNSDHPYRQKIEGLFNGRVEIFTKDKLLQGAGFNPTTVQEQLNILILSFDTFRAKNKEDRKIYQENGNLAQFVEANGNEVYVKGADETSLMNIIHKLNPVVVVDESHNAETELSVDMLNNLNPCFILDLTATPRKNSNIVSYVSSIELKKEHMVKLPVIVYNHHDISDVINNALHLQKSLELKAKELEAKGEKYIRPIVLFQAQPQNQKEETVTFEKIKEKLIKVGIPKEQIAIKTANINEIKQRDLLDKDCPIRYIITINALKEGWDCPFAYILASLANKSSEVDVTQILGRILRQPYARQNSTDLLNISYVFTASTKFYDTLNNIITGLNNAGFSNKQFRLDTDNKEEDKNDLIIVHDATNGDSNLFESEDKTNDELVIDESKIIFPTDETKLDSKLQDLQNMAIQQTNEFTESIEKIDIGVDIFFGTDLENKIAKYPMKDSFKDTAESIVLPQFFMEVPKHDLFTEGKEEVLLNKQALLTGFNLAKKDTEIAFEDVGTTMFQVDVKENTKGDSSPEYSKSTSKVRNTVLQYLASQTEEQQKKTLATMIFQEMRKIDGIVEKDLKAYIVRVVEGLPGQHLTGIKENPYAYGIKIREKVEQLMIIHCEKQFSNFLDSDKISIKPNYKLASAISPGRTTTGITKSLYDEEAEMNGFEIKVINEIANCDNILRWHKNIERNGFYINGHINHYPDFIVYTKSKKIILVESKGDHLDNTDSQMKVNLGKKRANKAGDQYKYFMVFQDNQVEGAHKLDDFMKLIKEI